MKIKCNECQQSLAVREINAFHDELVTDVVATGEIEAKHYAHVGGGIYMMVGVKPRGEESIGSLCPNCFDKHRERKIQNDKDREKNK